MHFSIAPDLKRARTLGVGTLVLLFGHSVVCGTPSAHAAPRQADAGTTYDFHRHYQPGEVDRYKVTLLVIQTGGNIPPTTYTMVVRETVKSLTPAGAMTLIMEFEQATTDSEGQTDDLTKMMPRVTQIVDPQGRAKITYEGRIAPITKVMLALLGKVGAAVETGLPPKPVKVGETWKLTPPDPNIPWSGFARLEGLESLRQYQTLKVNFATDTAPPGPPPTKVHTDATLHVEAQTGKTIQLDTKMDSWEGQQKTSVEIHYNSLDEAAYTVRRTYKVGEVERYLLSRVTTTNAPGGADHPVKNELRLKETVKEVTPEGNITLEYEVEHANYIVDNREVDITAKMPRITQTRNGQGGFQVKVEGGDPEVSDPIMELMVQIGKAQNDVIPPKPIRVGGSWHYTGGALDKKTSGNVTLTSVERINGVQALILERVSDMASAEASVGISHEKATVSVDAQTGKTIKLTSHLVTSRGPNKTIVDTTYFPIGDKEDVGGKGVK